MAHLQAWSAAEILLIMLFSKILSIKNGHPTMVTSVPEWGVSSGTMDDKRFPFLGMEHDAGKDAARMNAEAASGEECVAVGVGADARKKDVVGGDTACRQLLAVALREVDVPLLFYIGCGEALCEAVHQETSLTESVIDFVAHLKGFERDARANNGMKRLGMAAAPLLHLADGLLGDAGNRSSPSCMDGSCSMSRAIIYNNRYTVGGRYADTDVRG